MTELESQLLAALEALHDVVAEREQGSTDLDEELEAAETAINLAYVTDSTRRERGTSFVPVNGPVEWPYRSE